MAIVSFEGLKKFISIFLTPELSVVLQKAGIPQKIADLKLSEDSVKSLLGGILTSYIGRTTLPAAIKSSIGDDLADEISQVLERAAEEAAKNPQAAGKDKIRKGWSVLYGVSAAQGTEMDMSLLQNRIFAIQSAGSEEEKKAWYHALMTYFGGLNDAQRGDQLLVSTISNMSDPEWQVWIEKEIKPLVKVPPKKGASLSELAGKGWNAVAGEYHEVVQGQLDRADASRLKAQGIRDREIKTLNDEWGNFWGRFKDLWFLGVGGFLVLMLLVVSYCQSPQKPPKTTIENPALSATTDEGTGE